MAAADDTLAALLSGLGGDTTGSADLTAFNKTIAANNLLSNIASPVLGAKFDTSTWSPNESLAVNSGKAFLGSILAAAGQRQQEDQLSSLTNILPQLYKDPTHTVLPEGMDADAFNNIKMNAIKDEAKRKFTAEAQAQETKSAIMRQLFSQNPGMAEKALSPDLAALGISGASDPLAGASPEFKQALIDAGGDKPAARQFMKDRIASEATLGRISNSIAVMKDLEGMKSYAGKLPGAALDNIPIIGDWLAGTGNASAASMPGSPAANYNSKIVGVGDALLPALTGVGRGSQYTQKQIKEDLSIAMGKGPQALADRLRNYQDILMSGAKEKAQDLVDNRHIPSTILDKINGLNLDDPSTLQDIPEHQLPPPTADFIAAAKAAGLSKEEARQKWKDQNK